ncbi:MAG: hypothetical protein QM726_15780 [Chitinophagaceae bacterium]
MKKTIVSIAFFTVFLYGQSQINSSIAKINDLCNNIDYANLLTKTDTIKSGNENGESLILFLSTSKQGARLKRCEVRMLSNSYNEESKGLKTTSSVFYFFKNKLIKVSESINEELSDTWYFSNGELIYYRLKTTPIGTCVIEERKNQLLTMADNFLAKSK